MRASWISAVLSAAAAVLLLGGAGIAPAADLAGSWKGTWTKDGDALPVVVSFARQGDGWTGTFDSDALQVAGIPFADVRETDGKVHWLLKGDATTASFDGTLAGDTLDGGFSEAGKSGAFHLVRSEVAPADFTTRDVSFGDGEVTLAGTLLMPAGAGAHPAIAFLHGSGAEGRWANRYLAQKCAEAGIAALVYDKRGVGGSTGDWRKAGFDALAADGAAAVAYLRTQKDIDPAAIGIYGHSQGGTFAPLVAKKDGRLAFVVAAAAGGLLPADVEAFSIDNSINLRALDLRERKDAESYVQALIDVAYGGKPRARLDALAKKFRARSWYFPPPPKTDPYWTFSRLIAGFDPLRAWSQVRAPVLLLYGAHDARVPAIRSVKAIRDAVYSGDNGRVTVKFYPDADHTFTVVDPPKQGGWPKHEPDYADVVTAWIKAAVAK